MACSHGIDIKEQDGALVGSVECRIAGDYDSALEVLKQRMRNVACAVEDRGGLVGHVKFATHEQVRGHMLSLTDIDDLQVKQADAPAMVASGAVIVVGLSEDTFREILHEAFA